MTVDEIMEKLETQSVVKVDVSGVGYSNALLLSRELKCRGCISFLDSKILVVRRDEKYPVLK